MTRYQTQHQIYVLMMEIYPELQHQELEKHLTNLWKCPDAYLEKYLNVTKDIATWKLQTNEVTQ
jgi:hypothetical protein